MLVVALVATLIGFGLLVAALVTGTLWLALACIVVCVLGCGFLLADLVGVRRKTPAATSDDAPAPAVDGDEIPDDEWAVGDDVPEPADPDLETGPIAIADPHTDVIGSVADIEDHGKTRSDGQDEGR